MTCTPQSLATAAACYRCLPDGMSRNIKTWLLCQWANKTPEPEGCTDPIVVDWLARIAAGGAPRPSDETIDAVCDFCTALRLAGLQDKFVFINPMIPDSFAAMLYPLIYEPTNGVSPWINNGFVAGDLALDGLLGGGDGSGKWLNTKYIPSNPVPLGLVGLDQVGMTVYTTTFSTGFEVGECELGCVDVGLNSMMFLDTFSVLNITPIAAAWDDNWIIPGIPEERPGFYSANRTAMTEFRYYFSNSTNPLSMIGSSNLDQSLSSLTPLEVAVMALRHSVSGIEEETSKRVSFAAVHGKLYQEPEAMGFTEIQDLFDAVQAMRVAFGGGWI